MEKGIGSVFMIESPRLLLLSTPLAVLKTRLLRDDFSADIALPPSNEGQGTAAALRVHFPPEWPGDALGLFPRWAARLEATPAYVEWGGTLIERAEHVAVGQMSFKDLPDGRGCVELGYGINPAYRNRGYATEMARALTGWALAQPAVRRVTAECLVDNSASARVLDKAGFTQIGRRLDEEGELLVWERTA